MTESEKLDWLQSKLCPKIHLKCTQEEIDFMGKVQIRIADRARVPKKNKKERNRVLKRGLSLAAEFAVYRALGMEHPMVEELTDDYWFDIKIVFPDGSEAYADIKEQGINNNFFDYHDEPMRTFFNNVHRLDYLITVQLIQLGDNEWEASCHTIIKADMVKPARMQSRFAPPKKQNYLCPVTKQIPHNKFRIRKGKFGASC